MGRVAVSRPVEERYATRNLYLMDPLPVARDHTPPESSLSAVIDLHEFTWHAISSLQVPVGHIPGQVHQLCSPGTFGSLNYLISKWPVQVNCTKPNRALSIPTHSGSARIH